MKTLSFGSCRIQALFDVYSEYEDIFFENKIGSQYSIIDRCHSLPEFYELLLYLYNSDTNHTDNILTTLKNDDLDKNIDFLRSKINEIDIFIFEFCSLKYYKTANGKIVYGMYKSYLDNKNTNHLRSIKKKHGNITEYELTNDEINHYLNLLIELILIKNNKKIIFVSHYMHRSIQNREIIKNSLDIIISKYNNIFVFTPSDLWSVENLSDFLLDDENHYLVKKIPIVFNFFRQKYKEFLN
jgi:hypothetical protein